MMAHLPYPMEAAAFKVERLPRLSCTGLSSAKLPKVLRCLSHVITSITHVHEVSRCTTDKESVFTKHVLCISIMCSWHHLWDHVAEELEYNLARPLGADINIKED